MRKREHNFYGLEKEVLALKKPGQNLDDATKDRDRKFSERAAAIEKLRQARVGVMPPTKIGSAKNRKEPKPAL